MGLRRGLPCLARSYCAPHAQLWLTERAHPQPTAFLRKGKVPYAGLYVQPAAHVGRAHMGWVGAERAGRLRRIRTAVRHVRVARPIEPAGPPKRAARARALLALHCTALRHTTRRGEPSPGADVAHYGEA